MAVATPIPSRTEEIRLIWTENQWLYIVTGFLGGVLFCLLTQLSLQNLPQLIGDLLPEAAGILVTVTVIDVLNRRRDERNAIKQLQEQLVRDVSSTSNEIAKNAIHQLSKRGWLEGDKGLLAGADLEDVNLQGANLGGANLRGVDLIRGNLQNANLTHANLQGSNLTHAKLQGTNLGSANLQEAKLYRTELQGAKLWMANLQGSDLMEANLQGANLGSASLQGAKLRQANLQGAKLGMANLQGADLWRANLQGADLSWVNLQSANLAGVNLKGANLEEAKLENAYFGRGYVIMILPDGTKWTLDTDLTKFTHPPRDPLME